VPEVVPAEIDPLKLLPIPRRAFPRRPWFVDCFTFRNKIGVDVAVEALQDYRRLRKGTVDELWRQADRLRMTRVIRPYWDAMAS